MGRGPPQVLGRNLTSAGRPAGQTGLWAGVPTLNHQSPPPPAAGCVLSPGSQSARGAVPVAEPAVLLVSLLAVLERSSLQEAPERRLREGAGGSRCRPSSRDAAPPGGSQGPVPLDLEQPHPQDSQLLGSWVLAIPSCGPLTRPVGDLLTQPWGERKKNFCDLCLVSPAGCVSEFRRDLRASHPGRGRTSSALKRPHDGAASGRVVLAACCLKLGASASPREGRGGGDERSVCREAEDWVSPAAPPPLWSSLGPAFNTLSCSRASSATRRAAGPGLRGMPAEKGAGRKLRRRAQQGPRVQ